MASNWPCLLRVVVAEKRDEKWSSHGVLLYATSPEFLFALWPHMVSARARRVDEVPAMQSRMTGASSHAAEDVVQSSSPIGLRKNG